VVQRTIRLLPVAVAAAGLACAPARPPATLAPPPAAPATPPPAAAPPTAASPAAGTGLAVTVEPIDAEILIDGRPYGKVSELPPGGFVPLQPGLYQVSLRRAGFATWRAEVALRSGVEPIRVVLARRP
jgi:hypothetical protein